MKISAEFLVSAAGYGWYVLEQRAIYGVMGPMPTWFEPSMIAPAALLTLLMWRIADQPLNRAYRPHRSRHADASACIDCNA